MRAFLAALVLLPSAAQAQQPACMTWPQMMKHLAMKYKEIVVGGGQIDAQSVVTMFASPNGDTFTIVRTSRDGMSCMITGGKDWDLGKFPEKQGEPT